MQFFECKEMLHQLPKKHWTSSKPRGDEIECILLSLAALLLANDQASKNGRDDKERVLVVSNMAKRLELGIDGSKIRKRIQALEAAFSVNLFQWKRQRAIALDVSSDAIRRLEAIANNYYRLSKFATIRPTIRIGCGLGLVPHFIPENIWRFRRRNPELEFEVEIVSDLPQNIRKRANKGLLDLAITSFTEDEVKDYGDELHSKELTMRLLVDRRSERLRNFTNAKIKEADLKAVLDGMIVAVPDPIRSPNLSFPIALLPSSATSLQVERWFEALAMTRSGGSVVCAAFPQIFPGHQRSRFKEFELLGSRFPRLRLGVLRPEITKRNKSDVHNRITSKLRDHFANEINDISVETAAEPTPMSLLRTAHATRKREEDGEQLRWVHGTMNHWATTPTGSLRSEHVYHIPWHRERRDYRFAIDGHISVVEGATDSGNMRYITWSAEEESSKSRAHGDSYAAALSGLDNGAGEFIGIWSGRAVEPLAAHETPIPDSGLFVLYESEDERCEKALSEICDEFLGNLPSRLAIEIPEVVT